MPYKVDGIDPRRTAMIVVDMENDFIAPGADGDPRRLSVSTAHVMTTDEFVRLAKAGARSKPRRRDSAAPRERGAVSTPV